MKITIPFLFLAAIAFIITAALFISGNSKAEKSCQGISDSSKKQCWQEEMDQTLKKGGLEQAFILMDKLYNTEPLFASDCHAYSHLLGQKAYELFAAHKEFTLSAKSSYCGYGFYHGFMEALLQKTGDMNEARKFCEYADSQLKKTTSDAGGACYHGIGHGAVDGGDQRFWGDAQKMVEPALAICEKVSDDEIPAPRYGKLFRCVSGAFNALEILSDSNQYKLSANREDPFWICKKQPDKYKEACYTQFVVSLMKVSNNDFIKSAKVIDNIKEDEYALPAMQALVVELPHLGKTDYKEALNYCRSIGQRFHEICITAFAEGLLRYGPPQKEYVGALNFCSSNLLTDAEKKACFMRILSILRIWYTASESQSICKTVEEKYQWNNCLYLY